MRAQAPRRRGARAGRGRLPAALVALAVAAGTALMLRPFAVEAVSAEALRQSSVAFVEEAEADPAAEEAVRLAREMNALLALRERPDVLDEGAPQGYWEWPGVDSRGRMASVECPRADLCVPVWRGTSEADLSRGAGHLPGTSLPVGGPGTRCVLVGHTDYQGQTLFSRISRLEPGDEVRLTSVAGTLVYRVRGMRVIAPDDFGALAVEPGADVLTLLTCWPPSVNTSRLIVDCVRAGAAPARRLGSAAVGEVAWWRGGAACCALCAAASAASGAAAFGVAGGLRRQGEPGRARRPGPSEGSLARWRSGTGGVARGRRGHRGREGRGDRGPACSRRGRSSSAWPPS